MNGAMRGAMVASRRALSCRHTPGHCPGAVWAECALQPSPHAPCGALSVDVCPLFIARAGQGGQGACGFYLSATRAPVAPAPPPEQGPPHFR